MTAAAAPRTYLVTGAAGGIGNAICERLLTDGDSVLGTDREARADRAAKLDWVAADLTTDSGRAAVVAACPQDLDGLVMAAGILDACGWERISEAEIHHLLAVNLVAPFLLFRALLPRLREGAAVVLVGSIAAIRSAPATPLYAASKAALHNLAATLAILAQEREIRVNVLAPGLIDTPLTDSLNVELAASSGQDPAAVGAARAHAVPMGRAGTPGEVADACRFLLGDQSTYMTGSTLFLTGGAMAGVI